MRTRIDTRCARAYILTMDAALMPLHTRESTMRHFTLIRSYSCRSSIGFVYELDGKRCASLARSLEALKLALGAGEGDSVVQLTVAQLAAQTGETVADLMVFLKDLACVGRAPIVAIRETVKCVQAKGPMGMMTLKSISLHLIDGSGHAHHARGLSESEAGFVWAMP